MISEAFLLRGEPDLLPNHFNGFGFARRSDL